MCRHRAAAPNNIMCSVGTEHVRPLDGFVPDARALTNHVSRLNNRDGYAVESCDRPQGDSVE